MKKMLVIAGVLGASQLATAGVPPALQHMLDYGRYYEQDAKTKEWKFNATSVSCEGDILEAKDAGVADDLKVDVAYDTPDFKAGKHTFKELQDYCEHARRSEAIYKTVGWFKDGWNDSDSGDIAAKCIEFYGQWTAEFKIPGTLKLPYEGISTTDPATGDPFVGTIEDGRKKFCDGHAKKFLAAKEKAEGPYRKVLKEDKLDVALHHAIEKVIYGPGKKELKTPAALAGAKVWFRETWYDDSPCNHGADKIHTLTRYEFDGAQKLVKDSGKNFCGPVPVSAYK